MGNEFLKILAILALVAANGFFVAAEFAIVKVRSTQIETSRYRRGKRATIAKHIVAHLDAYLSATQLGITLASLGLGWAGEPFLADMIAPVLSSLGLGSPVVVHSVAFAIAFGTLTFLHITLGELAPKSVAIQHAEPTALLVSIPLQLFYQIFKPAIWVLNGFSNFILRIVGIHPPSEAELVHSPQELRLLLSEGTKVGVIDQLERELIDKIFEFTDTRAKEVMIPRTDVVAIEMNTPHDKLIKIVTEEGYSRMPVYNETIDHIVGVVYTKDLITLLEHRDLIVLHDIIRPAYFVPDTKKISQLMREFQQKKIHLAIVVDEFGGTEGIITMEDILEEIVGEIHDEYDEVLKEVEASADGSFLVNARVPIREFNERFRCELPEDADYETIGGFLYKVTGRIPDINETIQYKSLSFTLVSKSERRMRQIKVRKTTNGSSTPPTDVPRT
jgi:CBS domain containing-hemolysin-like protein